MLMKMLYFDQKPLTINSIDNSNIIIQIYVNLYSRYTHPHTHCYRRTQLNNTVTQLQINRRGINAFIIHGFLVIKKRPNKMNVLLQSFALIELNGNVVRQCGRASSTQVETADNIDVQQHKTHTVTTTTTTVTITTEQTQSQMRPDTHRRTKRTSLNV